MPRGQLSSQTKRAPEQVTCASQKQIGGLSEPEAAECDGISKLLIGMRVRF